MRDETSNREHIKAEVHKSWFSVAIGQIVFNPYIQLGRPSSGERLSHRFPSKCCMAIKRATSAELSPDELDFAARHGSLGHDGHGNFLQRHRLLNHSVWAAMMLYIGWFFLASLLPAWRSALPSRHMELLFITLLTLALAIRFHRVLFLSQRLARRAVLATTTRTSHREEIWH